MIEGIISFNYLIWYKMSKKNKVEFDESHKIEKDPRYTRI